MLCGIRFYLYDLFQRGSTAEGLVILLKYNSHDEFQDGEHASDCIKNGTNNTEWQSFYDAPFSTRKALHFAIQSPLVALLYPELL